MLVLGFHLEKFQEGYAKITLCFADIISKWMQTEPVVIVNANSTNLSLERIIKSLYPDLARRFIRIYDIHERAPIMPVILEESIASLISDKFIIIGWRPCLWLSLLLNKHRNDIICLVFSRNIFSGIIRYICRIPRMKSLIVLNPFSTSRVGNIKFIKVYPPVHEKFFEVGNKTLRKKPQQDSVLFKLMGRFHPSRGIAEALRAFKKFKLRRPDAKAKLVIDAFSEYKDKSYVKSIDDGVEVHMWDPLNHVRNGSLSPEEIINIVMNKYVESSYIMLPYTFRQFIEPPLTLLEALATGSFLVTTDLLKPFIESKDAALIVSSKKIVEELVNAFEYLYDIYDSRYYWTSRKKAFEYATKTFSCETVKRALGDVLDRNHCPF